MSLFQGLTDLEVVRKDSLAVPFFSGFTCLEVVTEDSLVVLVSGFHMFRGFTCFGI